MSGQGKRPRHQPRAQEVRARLAEITQLYLRGYRPMRLEMELATKWGVGHRSVRRYLHRARQILALEARRVETDEGQRRLRAEMRARLTDLYCVAVTEGELAVASGLCERLIRLDALNRPEKQELTATHNIGSHTSDEDLERVLRDELRRMEGRRPEFDVIRGGKK